MGVLCNKIERDELKPGDHIYSWRKAYIYAHHGIYMGNESVIHYTRGAEHEAVTGTFLDRYIYRLSSSVVSSRRAPCRKCGDQSGLNGAIESCLDCFLSGGFLYRFEYGVNAAYFLANPRGGTCTLAKSDSQEEVMRRARFLLEKGFGVYDLLKNNCEHFALYCKTGLLMFTSLERPGRRLGLFCVRRLVSDIGFRRDVHKVPVEKLVECLGSDSD